MNQPKNAIHDKQLFHPGQHLGGRYQVISCLGRGGMGVVYHVAQMFVNKEYALKTIENQTHDQAAMRRFQEEARTAFTVRHPNVISINDFGLLDDQTPFLVMELIHGETLAERLKRVGQMSVEDVTHLFMQICAGLACAHEQNVIHRDVKPSNIMLLDDVDFGTEGSIRIVDFGIAKVSSDTDTGAPHQALTRNGEIIGSPLYMSPEQCLSQKVDQRSDIYSLGCMMFEALTGTPPFIGENALTTMMKHQTDRAPSLKEASLGTTFPSSIEKIVHKMLEKSPANRYQNVRDVMRDLASTTHGEAPKAKAERSEKVKPKEEAKLTLSKPMFFGLIFLTVLLSAGLAALAAFTVNQAQHVKANAPFVDKRTEPNKNAEEGSLPLDQKTVDNAQILSLEILRTRLLHRDPRKPNYIALHFKKISHEDFVELGKNKWIKYLDLESSLFDNADLAEIVNLPDLHVVNVRGTNINNEGIQMIARCKKVHTLQASGTNLDDTAVEKMTKITTLNDLDLNSTQISDASFKYFAELPNLGKLEIGDCEIKGRGIAELKRCKIFKLDLHNTKSDDETLIEVSQLPQLQELSVRATGVSKEGLLDLGNKLKQTLRQLFLSKCPKLKPADIIRLKHNLPWIQIHDEQERPETDVEA